MPHIAPIFAPGRILLFNLLGVLLVWTWLSPSLLFWGINLFLFAAFMWRFAGLRVALVSIVFAVLLSASRILSGAHWFSDIFFAALAINLIVTPWILLTPLGPGLARTLTAGLIKARNALPGR
jgi:hypothetical protein